MIFLNGIKVGHEFFPNGEVNLLKIEEAIKARKGYEMNHVVMKYENDKDLMVLYFVKKQLDVRTGGDRVRLTVSYLPYSRMDRAETPQTPFMLKFVCEYINELNFAEVVVFEPHSQVTGELLDRCRAVFSNVDLLDYVKKSEGFIEGVDYLVFPDNGAFNRYNGRIKGNNIIIGKKKRNFETGRIESLELVDTEGNTVNGGLFARKAIIVDDLSSYGGTFVKTSKALKELNIERVALLVTHAENSVFKGELFDHIDMLYTTDTILSEQNHWNNLRFKDQLKVFGLVNQELMESNLL